MSTEQIYSIVHGVIADISFLVGAILLAVGLGKTGMAIIGFLIIALVMFGWYLEEDDK